MFVRCLTIPMVLLLTVFSASGAGQQKQTEVSPEIKVKLKAFEESVKKSKTLAKADRDSIANSAPYMGKPYFLGDTDNGSTGFFIFWLVNPSATPTYRSYYIDVTTPVGQAMMKTVLFGFEQKAQLIVVYEQPTDPNKPQFVIVYP